MIAAAAAARIVEAAGGRYSAAACGLAGEAIEGDAEIARILRAGPERARHADSQDETRPCGVCRNLKRDHVRNRAHLPRPNLQPVSRDAQRRQRKASGPPADDGRGTRPGHTPIEAREAEFSRRAYPREGQATIALGGKEPRDPQHLVTVHLESNGRRPAVQHHQGGRGNQGGGQRGEACGEDACACMHRRSGSRRRDDLAVDALESLGDGPRSEVVRQNPVCARGSPELA